MLELKFEEEKRDHRRIVDFSSKNLMINYCVVKLTYFSGATRLPSYVVIGIYEDGFRGRSCFIAKVRYLLSFLKIVLVLPSTLFLVLLYHQLLLKR